MHSSLWTFLIWLSVWIFMWRRLWTKGLQYNKMHFYHRVVKPTTNLWTWVEFTIRNIYRCSWKLLKLFTLSFDMSVNLFAVVPCPELIKPQEGKMHCQHPMGQFSYQSTCEFMCDEGYTLRDSSSATLFCGATGQWNDTQPTCESKTGLNLLRKTSITIVQQFCFLLFNISALRV